MAGDNEVGLLSRSFESMRGNILRHREELEDKNERLLAARGWRRGDAEGVEVLVRADGSRVWDSLRP